MALRTLADALSTLSTPASTKSRQPQKPKLIDLLHHRPESCVDNSSAFVPRRQSTSQPLPVRPLNPFHSDLRQQHLTDLVATPHATMARSKLWAVAPGVFSITGVFLFHVGFLSAATIYVLSLLGGSVNAIRPALIEEA